MGEPRTGFEGNSDSQPGLAPATGLHALSASVLASRSGRASRRRLPGSAERWLCIARSQARQKAVGTPPLSSDGSVWTIPACADHGSTQQANQSLRAAMHGSMAAGDEAAAAAPSPRCRSVARLLCPGMPPRTQHSQGAPTPLPPLLLASHRPQGESIDGGLPHSTSSEENLELHGVCSLLAAENARLRQQVPAAPFVGA